MIPPEPFSKITLETDEGGPLTAIYLPIEPYSLALFVAEEDQEDSHALIDEVAAVWPCLWPKVRKHLETDMKDYGVDAVLGQDEFVGVLGRMTPGVYKGDQSDVMIRLEFDSPPLWDFFVKGSDIVHFQPVF